MSSDMKAAIEKRFQELVTLYNAGDFTTMVTKCYTPDCKTLSPGKEVEIGHQLLISACESLVKTGLKSYKVQSLDIEGSPDGGMVYSIARNQTFKDDGTEGLFYNEAIIWKKIDGAYYAHVDIWNS
ncbi:uncharacterized protein LOC100368946 [Saccoglossus kowalevskii]|uniref:Uncharacterized protein LOC100368946 n=1 Tax=Saccoglossus kowalevskii TaxID=10224 RepID=A0ABM0GU59_SACKO|nr:PREDICTED: uncharacterized protein LOC100368946 [Saccoglossus kowalevskii]